MIVVVPGHTHLLFYTCGHFINTKMFAFVVCTFLCVLFVVVIPIICGGVFGACSAMRLVSFLVWQS